MFPQNFPISKKSECVQTETEPLSKDRLRRIQGMSCYADTVASYGNTDDSMLVNGDTIIFSSGNSYVLANIILIKIANKKVTSIDLSANDVSTMENAEFTVRNLTEEVEGKTFWNREHLGQDHVVDAKLCLPIHPLITLDPPLGLSKFYFDAQMVKDIRVDLVLNCEAASTSTSWSSSSSVPAPG